MIIILNNICINCCFYFTFSLFFLFYKSTENSIQCLLTLFTQHHLPPFPLANLVFFLNKKSNTIYFSHIVLVVWFFSLTLTNPYVIERKKSQMSMCDYQETVFGECDESWKLSQHAQSLNKLKQYTIPPDKKEVGLSPTPRQ